MQGLEARADETFDLFVSYAHADDGDGRISRFVELLRQVRDTQQYRSWQIFFDQKAIVAGDDWQQRLARVKAAGALIVLMSPNYFHNREPQWCRWEWQAFREQEQKPPHLERIFPIYLSTEGSLEDAACHDDWRKDMVRRQFIDLRDFWDGRGDETHVRQLLQRLERTISDRLKDYAHQRQMRRLGIPYQTFPLPPYFVPRPDDLNCVRQALLSPQSGTGLVMSAVYGMGGIGKTTLAADLVRQADIRDHFEDGILWATLGQNPEPRLLLSQWIVALGDHNFRSSEAGDYQTHLRSLLQNRKMLLVIDDAWSSEHVNWFRVGGERCRVLVTTRDAGIARAIHAAAYDLDVMTPEQSRALITGRLGRPLRPDEAEEAAALAEEVGRLPLALELIAAQVADGIPWDELREDLRREVARLRSLDLPDADEAVSEEERKKRSLLASVNLSLGRLTAVRRQRFAWLGVVPDDAVVNPLMTATLWGVDERTARDELRYLREKALLLAAPAVRIGEREHHGYRLHDLLHDAARHLLTSPKQPEEERQLPGLELELPAAHAELLSRYRRRTQQGQWHTLPEDGYIHRRLAWHFEHARDGAGLHGLLCEETADGRNGWFEANDRRGEMAVFADDVARAWRLAEEGWRAGSVPVLGLQVRYAMVTGSLNQMAGNLPPTLIEALVQKKVWPPAQGLAYANRIPELKNRASALIRLAPLFSETERSAVLAEALAAAREFRYEGDRSEVLAALAPHLPEGQRTEVLAEALAAARQISHGSYRSEALAELAPHLPEGLRAEVLAEALAAARQIGDEVRNPRTEDESYNSVQPMDARSRALAALAPHLPEGQRTEVLAEALDAAWPGMFWFKASRTLAALAPHLTEALLAEALAAARRAGVGLAALAPHLPEGQRTEVLAEALAAVRQIRRADSRSEALTELAPHLPEGLRAEVLAEALVAARQISDERDRSRALAVLAPRLPEALLAEALAAARQISDAGARSGALAVLAPRLPEALLAEALAAARQISDERDRSGALAALAPRLPEAQRTEVLAEALDAARRAGVGLAALAPHLSESQLAQLTEAQLTEVVLFAVDRDAPSEALAALVSHLPEALICELTSMASVRFELAALALHLPETQRTKVLAEILAVVRQISDERDRSRALAALAPHMPEAQRTKVLAEALAAARQISDGSYRSRALAALAPHMPEASGRAGRTIAWFKRLLRIGSPLPPRTTVVAEALADKWSLREEDYSGALAALSPHLSAAQLAEALAAAREFRDESHRSELLAALAPHLSEAQLTEALAAARQISDKHDSWKALAAMAPHLPEAQQAKVLAEALAAARQISDEGNRSRALAALAPHLPEVLLAEALADARQIGYENDRSAALAALAPHLPEALSSKALAAARQINTELLRSKSILTIVSHRISLSRDEQTQLLSECLRGLASQGRQPILEAQEDLLRLLHCLPGVDISAEVAEIAHAIRDVGRWFP